MPNGVICGGAVDGSNQLGEIVTCQAMTTRPAGAGAAAIDGLAPNSTMAMKSEPSARLRRPSRHEIIGASSRLSVAFYSYVRAAPRERRVPRTGGPETRSARRLWAVSVHREA